MKLDISDIRIVVYCNDEKVLDEILSDTICDDNEWSSVWRGDNMMRILFPPEDTASDFYFRPHFQMDGALNSMSSLCAKVFIKQE